MKRIVLHLCIEVQNTRRKELLEFLREARSFYEEIPGATVRLLQNRDNPKNFIEVIEYATMEAYELDQARVNTNAKMQAYLSRWRSLLNGPVRMEIYDDLTSELA